MQVITVPVLSDNYSYILLDPSSRKAAVVDPVEPEKVLAAFAKLDAGWELSTILTTHHHLDHSGGNSKLVKGTAPQNSNETSWTVYGGDKERIQEQTHQLQHLEEFSLGSLKITALNTKGHTQTHITYLVEDTSSDKTSPPPKALFTGDTLFLGGSGRFFEGTPQDMVHSLIHTMGAFPDDTLVYCGHEYTRSNLAFAKKVEPENKALLDRILEIENKDIQVTVPGNIGQEKLTNPFMRIHELAVQAFAGSNDPVKVMGALREAKNRG